MSYKDQIRRKKLTQQVVTIVKAVTGNLDLLDPAGIGGVDTDFYAGPFDFQTLKARGGKFAFIRAGQGLGIDSQFQNSWINSKGVLPRGAYWYLDKSVSMDAQARIFASLFPNGYDGELPIVPDLEQDVYFKQKDGTKVRLERGDAESFLTDIKRYMPSWDQSFITYSNWDWITTRHLEANADFWGTRPLWFASPGFPNPRIPTPWKRAAIVQTSFAGDGPFYGTLSSPGHPASKGIDLDQMDPLWASAFGIK